MFTLNFGGAEERWLEVRSAAPAKEDQDSGPSTCSHDSQLPGTPVQGASALLWTPGLSSAQTYTHVHII